MNLRMSEYICGGEDSSFLLKVIFDCWTGQAVYLFTSTHDVRF